MSGALIAATVRAPDWLAHRYDPGHDAFHFVHADRAARAAAPFLTDEALAPAAPRVIARADARTVGVPPAPVHFIFHSAFCCSTLLARALDVAGVATTLKEPQLLNDLVGWRHRGAPSDRLGAVTGDALALLARPFVAGEACIVKPSNVVNGLAEGMLALRPQARAVLLYAPLAAFVASIARKGLWGRNFARELLLNQLDDGMIDLGFAPRDYLLLTDLQVAAVGWLAQAALFARLASAGPRARLLDSETLTAQPGPRLAQVAAHFRLSLDDAAIAEIVAREFTREAKGGAAFAPGEREASRRAGHALHADEIDKVLVWADAVARNAGVAITPPTALHLA